MTMRESLRIMPCLLAGIILALMLQPYANADESYEELNTEVMQTVDRGLAWLKTQQGPDGLFRDHPGLTALAITAFLRHPQDKYTEANHPFIQKSIKALLKIQQPDGGIYDVAKQPALPNYNTSISLMALSSTKNP